jgi:hypothetical protein
MLRKTCMCLDRLRTGEPSDEDSYSDIESVSEPRLDARKRRRLVRAIVTAIEDALA